MKKNAFISKKNVFLRIAAFVFAAAMLFSAAACSQEADEVSSEDALTELKIDELDKDMTDLLIRFADWYITDEGKNPVYDCQKAGEGETNILRSIVCEGGFVDWEKYSLKKPKDVYNKKKLDPKKWAKENGCAYMIFDSKGVDWVAVNIFNVTDEDLEEMRAQAEENKWFYLDGDKYYKNIGGVGDPMTSYTFESAKTDGKVCYVNYSSKFDNGEETTPRGSYTAEVQKKTIDGKDYWTLNRFEQTSEGE